MKVDEACIPVYVGGRDSGETREKVKEVAKKVGPSILFYLQNPIKIILLASGWVPNRV